MGVASSRMKEVCGVCFSQSFLFGMDGVCGVSFRTAKSDQFLVRDQWGAFLKFNRCVQSARPRMCVLKKMF